eukprot:3147120-Rhodomonas_salina.3
MSTAFEITAASPSPAGARFEDSEKREEGDAVQRRLFTSSSGRTSERPSSADVQTMLRSMRAQHEDLACQGAGMEVQMERLQQQIEILQDVAASGERLDAEQYREVVQILQDELSSALDTVEAEEHMKELEEAEEEAIKQIEGQRRGAVLQVFSSVYVLTDVLMSLNVLLS